MQTRRRPAQDERDEDTAVDVLNTLNQDHEEVAELFEQMMGSDSASERKSLFAKIRAALVPHLRAEEKTVYDAVRELKDKEAQQHGEEGFIEHDLADRALAQLGKVRNANSPKFSAGAKVLKELIEHHVEEEEKGIWPDLRENFSEEERIELNRKFVRAKKGVRVPSA